MVFFSLLLTDPFFIESLTQTTNIKGNIPTSKKRKNQQKKKVNIRKLKSEGNANIKNILKQNTETIKALTKNLVNNSKSAESLNVSDLIKKMTQLQIDHDHVKHETPIILDIQKHTDYQRTILDPWLKLNAGVPNTWAYDTVKFHRTVNFTVSANALGAVALAIGPYFHDNSDTNTTAFYYNYTGYDGTNSNVNPNFGNGIPLPQAMPTGDVVSYRIVSMGAKVYTQDSALNRKGLINFALINGNWPLVSQTATTIGSGALNLSTIQNRKTFKIADVCSGEGAQIIWVPYDDSDLELLPINTNVDTMNPGHQQNIFMFIITGANASSIFKVELQYNLEANVSINSALFGMGSCEKPTNRTATNQIAEILGHHIGNVTSIFKSHADSAYSNPTTQALINGALKGMKWNSDSINYDHIHIPTLEYTDEHKKEDMEYMAKKYLLDKKNK